MFSLLYRRASCMVAATVLGGCTDLSGSLCTFFCSDTTQLQREYVEARDECRELAELKIENMPEGTSTDAEGSAAIKSRRTRLVSHFSECMNNKTWAVPGPAEEKDKKKDAAPIATAAGAPAKIESPQPAPEKVLDAERKKTADCAFARQAADSSIVAKKRAEACDIECTQQKRVAPEAPKPAACP